jgi:adenylate cyclase
MPDWPIEFERKFRVKPEAVSALLGRAHQVDEIRQGYFMEDAERCVRIRSRGPDFVLTFKCKTDRVGKAVEVETMLESAQAQSLLSLCRTGVHKRRHLIRDGAWLWEVDVFLDHNTGLVLAEVELDSDEDSERLSGALPDWVEREVTGQAEYFNTWLAANTLVEP